MVFYLQLLQVVFLDYSQESAFSAWQKLYSGLSDIWFIILEFRKKKEDFKKKYKKHHILNIQYMFSILLFSCWSTLLKRFWPDQLFILMCSCIYDSAINDVSHYSLMRLRELTFVFVKICWRGVHCSIKI